MELINLDMRPSIAKIFMGVVVIGFLASCSDVGITKRLYRPSFHIDLTSQVKVISRFDRNEIEQSYQSLEPKMPALFASSEKNEDLSIRKVENAFQKAIREERKADAIKNRKIDDVGL